MYAAYGGVYVDTALVWLRAVDDIKPTAIGWLGIGVLLDTRKDDGVQIVELQWTLASGAKALMYTRNATMTLKGREEQMRHAMLVIQQKEQEKIKTEKLCLNLLKLVPTEQLTFEKYNKDVHPPRVNMSDFPVDRKERKVLSLTLRGKNFTDTIDIEMHEDSILLHLYLKIYEELGIPMIHMHNEEAKSGANGIAISARRTAAPAASPAASPTALPSLVWAGTARAT